MRGWPAAALIGSSLVALTLACHGGALLGGGQYAYRDAAHYYYPLHQRVQQEWSAGRWPLWDPSENAGMPLLGNPTAAVLYPGKLIFAAVPFPMASRLYIVGHTLLAFGAMFGLTKAWGASPIGSALAGLAYAFGVPVLFQYSNVIYLVGAAWAPLGMLAVDRWVRLGDRRAIPALALVLTMETLGGDPETAYLTGVFAIGYAAWLATRRDGRAAGTVALGLVVLGLIGTGATLFVASRAPSWRPPAAGDGVTPPLPWMPWVRPVVGAGWVLAGLVVLGRWIARRKAGRRSDFGPTLAGLVASASLAASISAAQLLPVLEFTAQSGRSQGDGAHEIYPFSLDPARLVEFAWPNATGTIFEGNHSWLEALNPTGKVSKAWVPSLYLGALTLVLALSASPPRDAPAWRVWIVAVGVFSLLASFGEYASPVFLARHSGLASTIGGLDPGDAHVIRLDGRLRDGDGGVYWALATFLPGFRSFRYPAKCLTFTAIALAALAAQGWDGLASGDPRTRRRLIAWSSGLLGLTLVALVAASMGGQGYLARLADRPRETRGPLQVEAAYRDLRQGLVQGGIVLGVALGMALAGAGRVRALSLATMVLMVADLALANAGQVLTVPQRIFEGPAEVVEIIERSERAHPAGGPFRVHRMPIWQPPGWSKETAIERNDEFLGWERGTLQPKYGISLGVEYTMTIGVTELQGYQEFFRPHTLEANPKTARALGITAGREIVVYTRRAFDLWNTRYFVLPFYAGQWNDTNRGFASFLARTEPVYPPADAFQGEGGRRKRVDWIESNDFQVRRNLVENPRAWVVHRALERPADPGLDEALASDDDLTGDSSRVALDLKTVAWLDHDRLDALKPFLGGRSPTPSESVRVVRHESDRVELKATLERPGLVVLADLDYPGWTLTIDGQAAPIERANRRMRAAAVAAGEHTLVYEYRPMSFWIGLVVTGLTLAGLVSAGLGAAWKARISHKP